jgi:hypothetical protein
MSINSALNITRRMPPKDIEDNLSGLISLIPDETDECTSLQLQLQLPLNNNHQKQTRQLHWRWVGGLACFVGLFSSDL